jgi:hypothetical protein
VLIKIILVFHKSKIYKHENMNIRIIDFEDLLEAKKHPEDLRIEMISDN